MTFIENSRRRSLQMSPLYLCLFFQIFLHHTCILRVHVTTPLQYLARIPTHLIACISVTKDIFAFMLYAYDFVEL